LLCYYLQYRESGRGRNMLQSFSLSFCLLSVLLARCLIVRGFFGRCLKSLKNWWPGRFFFCLTAHSCLGHRALLVQCLSTWGYCRAVLSERLGSIAWHLLTSRKTTKDQVMHAFSIDIFLLQIKDLPRWWARWTDGLYRGSTQEKNYLLLVGNEPGLPSCESDVLPLDHRLTSCHFFCQLLESG
jgi:hypothetical protein